jgi:hypothetical protein
LENPTTEEPEAFEALVQLAVLVQLLSEQPHELVPFNKEIQPGSGFNATKMFHVAATVKTLEGIVQVVHDKFDPGSCFRFLSGVRLFNLHKKMI